MKKILIISFDLIREDEPEKSLSTASLLAFLKHDKRHGADFFAYHLPINILKFGNSIKEADAFLSGFCLEKFDAVAISCYIWSEHLTNPLIARLRERGFRKNVILGGPQISYSEHIFEDYPDCQIFIRGYGEQSLLDAVLHADTLSKPLVLSNNICFDSIPSVYATGEIELAHGQKMARLETKRGCPYRCSFCAHRDLGKNKIRHFPKERVFEELSILKEKSVRKINVLDPVFNTGHDYLDILGEMRRMGLDSEISLQTRFENINGEKGEAFMKLCSEMNVCLEFGVQTVVEEEYRAINRPNKVGRIKSLMRELNERNISYETSLIYGLPNQTFDSFRRSVDFVTSNACENVSAFPLMLLKGTELYAEKEKWDFREKKMGKFGIPLVVGSSSFDEDEWHCMKDLAEHLNPRVRV